MFVFRYLKLLFRILVDIRQTSKWSFLTRMCFVDPHELYKDLVVVVDPPRSTVRHLETTLHVDESRPTIFNR